MASPASSSEPDLQISRIRLFSPVMMILTAAAALRCQLIAADANAGSMPALP